LEEEYPYLVVDARYEKVREDGVIASRAVQVAIGINWKGGAACWEWSWRNGKARAVGKSFCWG
jgi:transposase-like protein